MQWRKWLDRFAGHCLSDVGRGICCHVSQVEEPKTPYHGPDVPDEFDEDPNPFALDASEGGASGSGMSMSDLGGGSGPSSNGDAGAGPSRARRSHSGGVSVAGDAGGTIVTRAQYGM